MIVLASTIGKCIENTDCKMTSRSKSMLMTISSNKTRVFIMAPITFAFA